MLEEYDYESLPNTCSTSDHMKAGALAGILEHCVMYPVDSLKTRMQCFKHQNEGIVRGLFKVFKNEGFLSSFRGIDVLVCGSGPAHALYFASYEFTKSKLSNNINSYYIAPAISGAVATVMHDCIMTPADTIKQRLQMYNSPYNSSLDCARQILHNEGPKAFYRSFIAQLGMNVPYQMLHFVLYELIQDNVNPSRSYSPLSHMLCGGLGGAIAAAATTPLDVCKTMLNTQEDLVMNCGNKAGIKPIKGLLNVAQLVFSKYGSIGFARGLSARVLTAMPGAAISWSVYEYFKWNLNLTRDDRTIEFKEM